MSSGFLLSNWVLDSVCSHVGQIAEGSPHSHLNSPLNDMSTRLGVRVVAGLTQVDFRATVSAACHNGFFSTKAARITFLRRHSCYQLLGNGLHGLRSHCSVHKTSGHSPVVRFCCIHPRCAWLLAPAARWQPPAPVPKSLCTLQLPPVHRRSSCLRKANQDLSRLPLQLWVPCEVRSALVVSRGTRTEQQLTALFVPSDGPCEKDFFSM